MITIGLTGGIGSGKTTVAQLFKKLGVPVYNSDKKAKKIMQKSKKLRKSIVSLLGEQAYDGENLNRSYIANKVFNDKKLLTHLNQIVHPEVRKDFLKWAHKQDSAYVIQETALLFENNAQKHYTKTILVTAPTDLKIDRLLKRDNSSKEQILARMKNQWTDGAKVALADFVIENIALEQTQKEVNALHQKILSIDYNS